MVNGSGSQWARERQNKFGKQVETEHPGACHKRMQLPQLALDVQDAITALTKEGRK